MRSYIQMGCTYPPKAYHQENKIGNLSSYGTGRSQRSSEAA